MYVPIIRARINPKLLKELSSIGQLIGKTRQTIIREAIKEYLDQYPMEFLGFLHRKSIIFRVAIYELSKSRTKEIKT